MQSTRSRFRSRPSSPTSGASPSNAGQTAKGVLKTTLQIAEKALDGLLIPAAKGTIGVLLEVITRLEKTTHNSEDEKELSLQLQRLTEAVLEPLEGREEAEISPNLILRLNKLVGDWENLPPLWKKVASHSKVRRFFERDIEANVIGDIAKKLQSSLDVFRLSGDLEREITGGKTLSAVKTMDHSVNTVIQTTQELLNDVQVLQKVAVSSEEYTLLRSLPTASASYNASSVNATVRCFAGTREKLIADVKTWLAEKPDKGSPICWLNGIAGIGKSTVARTMAEFAEEQKILGASFFFSRTDGRTNPAVFFTTIAYQLALVFPAFKKAIIRAIRDDPLVVDVALPLQIRKLIVDPLKSLDHIPPLVVVIVDALDECTPDGVMEILVHLLAQLSNLPSFKVLVTSRPEHHISHVLQAERNLSKIVMHDIEKSIVESDITLYIEFRFEEVGRKFPNSGWFWKLHELVHMVGMTGSLFIYAVTAMYFIENLQIRNPRRQLERLLKGKSPENTTLSPFIQLDKLYDQVVGDSMPPGNVKRLSQRFRTVVGAVIGLEEPLSLQSIEKLMNLEEEDAMEALSSLPSVIAVPNSSDGIPRIYHPSFSDYITNPDRCKHPKLVIYPSTNHLHILQRCFATMGDMLKRDLCKIADSGLLNSDIKDLEAKVEAAIPPWLRYAVTHWSAHLAAVPNDNAEAIAGLETFCTKNLLHWIEACSLLSSLNRVMPLISKAQEWAVNSSCTSQILDLLSDTLRLIPIHYDTIKTSTLHLYHSVLPFLPSTCTIAAVYKNEVKDGDLTVLGGREDNWERCINVLRGHTDSVRSVSFSRDSKYIVSSSDDKTARVWDASTGQHTLTLEGHADWVHSVMFAPDGKRIVSSSNDSTIRVWDADTGQEMLAFGGRPGRVRSVSFSQDGEFIVSSADDQTAHVWGASSGQLVLTLELGHTHYVSSVEFSWEGKQIVTGSEDMTVRIWDAVTGEGMFVLEGHTGNVNSASFSRDGKFVVSGSNDMTVRIWNSHNGQPLLILNGHTDEVHSVLFSQDGKQILSGSKDQTIRVWDSMTGQQMLKLEGHAGTVYSASFSLDGKLVVSGSDDHTIRVWDACTSQKILSRAAHRDAVNDVSFSQDGDLIVSASDDKTTCVWDAHTGRQMWLEGHTGGVVCAGFSSDRKHIITSSSDYTVRAWDVSTGVQTLCLQGYDYPVKCATFSLDGRLIGLGLGKNVHLSDRVTGQEIQVLSHNSYVFSVTFSQGGALVACGSMDGTVSVWETSAVQPLLALTGHSSIVWSVSFSPDDRFIVSGSRDRTARLWDVTTGQCLDTSPDFLSNVNSAKFYSTNPCVIQLQVDGEIRYWTPLLPPSPDNSNSNSVPTPPNRLALYPRYSAENRLIAVTWGPGQKPVPVGWLPPTFKVIKSDLYGSTMVMGGQGGEIFILKLPPSRTRS